MSHQRWEQNGRCAGPPIGFSGEDQGQQGHGADVPPDEAEDPTPRDAHAEAGAFVAEEQAVGHADDRTDEQMDEQTSCAMEAGAQASDPWKSTSGEQNRGYKQAADHAG